MVAMISGIIAMIHGIIDIIRVIVDMFGDTDAKIGGINSFPNREMTGQGGGMPPK